MTLSRWLSVPVKVLGVCVTLAALTGCVSQRHETMYVGLPNPDAVTPASKNPLAACPNLPLTKQGDPYVYELKCRAADELNLGRLDRAKVLYQKALKIEPNDAEIKLGYANCLYRLGFYDKAVCQTNEVIRGGGCHVPYAAQLEITMETASGNYDKARCTATELAKWAEKNGQIPQAIDANLTAARLSGRYLNDGPATWKYIEKAKSLLRPSDREAAARIAALERELKKTCMFYRLNANGIPSTVRQD
ncbi:MAG: tetratricopeptide repeat protein [Candidatus Sumerlaeaceae bacterium]|nr:tetratricopeptide repeat protein [Candidatus Sumerlaeaceae bacterium]